MVSVSSQVHEKYIEQNDGPLLYLHWSDQNLQQLWSSTLFSSTWPKPMTIMVLYSISIELTKAYDSQ